MALAVTHVIITIVILDIFRHYVFGLKKFPRYLLVIGGIAGLAPDLDIPLSWIVNLFSSVHYNFHGAFTHSFLWVIIFLIVAIQFHIRNNMKWAKIFYVIAVGWFMHLFLDWSFGEYKWLFWPFVTPESIFPPLTLSTYGTSIDAIILVMWLVHEEIHHKIKDYF